MHISKADLSLIERVDTILPNRQISIHFNECATLPIKDRLTYARRLLKETVRAGIVYTKVPENMVPSIHDHAFALLNFINIVDRLKLDLLPIKNNQETTRMSLVHDMIEALTTDITISDPIEKKEKHALEKIAARIIFAGNTLAYESWLNYQDNRIEDSELVHEADKIEFLTNNLFLEEQFPEIKEVVDIYFNHADKDLIKTNYGRELFNIISKDRNNLHNGISERSDIYSSTRHFYKNRFPKNKITPYTKQLCSIMYQTPLK